MAEPIVYGEYIVADPRICHGKLTFRGTRIMVKTILEHVLLGESWESISTDADGKVSVEAIAEAVNLACQVFIDHMQEYSAPPATEAIPARDELPVAV
jgi:uncharacterized protein (DUF433 family)